jgi:GTPase SAR1 family protein
LICSEKFTRPEEVVKHERKRHGISQSRAEFVCIIDIAGQDPFETLTYTWYSNRGIEKKKDTLILVYDITSRSSFEVIRLLFIPIEHSQNAVIILVGTKIDREQRREVQEKEAMELAKELGVSHWEVSAREGRGICEMLQCLVLLLLQRQANAATRKSFLKSVFHVLFSCMGGA